MSELYNRIEYLCKEAHISITTMCKNAKVSRASLSDLKMGRNQQLSADTLSKIAKTLGVSVGYLLGNDEENSVLEKAKSELTDFVNSNPGTLSGKRLDVLFTASGYDHVVVCFNLGIDQYYLDNWMNNNDLPPKPIVDKILGVFRLKPEDLLSSNELANYNSEAREWEAKEKAPTVPRERKPDVLDEVDIAFYGEYKQLTEDDKDTIRDMVRIMRERRAKKQE